MGFFSVKPIKTRPEPREPNYAVPREEEPVIDEETHETWEEQENFR